MTVTTPIPIVPTLDAQSILSNPQDILAYQLRYYITMPLSVSDTTSGLMISLADTVSRYQAIEGNLVRSVTDDLTTVYSRFFPQTGSLTVDVTTSDNGDGTYNITILLAVIVNGQSYTLGSDVTVGAAGNMVLTYHPN